MAGVSSARSEISIEKKNDTYSDPVHIVWLDKSFDSNPHQSITDSWRDFGNALKLYSNEQDCINYIKKQHEDRQHNIILIISDLLSERIISKIEKYDSVHLIFIVSTSSQKCDTSNKSSKFRTVYSNQSELLDDVRHVVDRHNLSLGFSLFNKQDNQSTAATGSKTVDTSDKYPIRNVKEDQARFLWFYKCHNFMLNLEDDDQEAKEEMLSALRHRCENERTSKILTNFQKESIEDNANRAIWWYTCNSIIFRSINEALVSGHIETIYSFRYLIRLICRQLTSLYPTYKKSQSNKKLTLYRGQRLKLSQILLISKHINDLISLNSFVSTTMERDIAKRFYLLNAGDGDESVMFEIEIDMGSEQSIPLADVRNYSNHPDEEEILISIGSIFCIESVRYDESINVYTIQLKLTQHDQLMVNEYIEHTFATEVDGRELGILFSKFLSDMGEHTFAIQYLQKQMNSLSDHNNHYRPTYLNNIGVCYNEINEKALALRHYKIASDIYKETNDRYGLGACYHNIASIYYGKQDYDRAHNWALQALDLRGNHSLEKASTLDLIGCIQLAKRDTEAASNNLREALRIRLLLLNEVNPYHPDIGRSYYNLGKLDMYLSNLIDAQDNYIQAEKIFRHNYSKTHPLVQETAACLEEVRRRL